MSNIGDGWDMSLGDMSDFGMGESDLTGLGGSSESGFDFSSLATSLQIVGALGKAYGTIQTGREIKTADDYNAALVRESGVMQEYQIGKEEVGLLSTQRAMYAKAGVTQSGSPLDTALQSAAGFELDKQIAKYNTESKANMLEWEGKMAKQKAQQQAGMQLLETAAMVAVML